MEIQENHTVLIVDDNPMMLKYWQRLCEEEPCQLLTTTSPKEALEILKKNTVDILITDMVMPNMDGFQLLAEAHALNPDLQMILTTGYPYDFERLPPSCNLDMLHVLLKPYHDIENVKCFIHYMLGDEIDDIDTFPPTATTANGKVHLWTL